MRENALKSLLAGYTLRHCVVWAGSNCNIRSEYSIVFCSCYPRSILTSFTSNCLLSTRLRHLTAFDDVVFAFNLMFHSDLWTAVALNGFHVSPLTLVAGTRCCVRNQNSTKQMQIIFCKILKKLKRFFYKVHMMVNSWGVITESKSYELYSCLGNFPRVFELF